MPATLASALARRDGRTPARLLPYFMVDRRRLSKLRRYARAARDAGADAVELGFPFTDPIADGPTLQAASVRALEHRTRWSDLLDAVGEVSEELPCAVMTYANPVFRRGLDAGIAALAGAGASGLIVPDLSLEESGPWRRAAQRSRVALVLMAAPGTAGARTVELVRATAGFLYLVSRYGVTGSTGFRATPELEAIVSASHVARPSLPVLVGFGVRSPKDAREVVRAGADGLVVGSALELRLASHPEGQTVRSFLGPIANAMRNG